MRGFLKEKWFAPCLVYAWSNSNASSDSKVSCSLITLFVVQAVFSSMKDWIYLKDACQPRLSASSEKAFAQLVYLHRPRSEFPEPTLDWDSDDEMSLETEQENLKSFATDAVCVQILLLLRGLRANPSSHRPASTTSGGGMCGSLAFPSPGSALCCHKRALVWRWRG